ncbi:MAG TPA: mycofactocin system FadH/OYE family oxidoreductase 2 [Streptosporangiaceae bacterium]
MSGPGPYRHLFSPLRVGPLTLCNRVVFAAHLTNYAENGLPTAQHAAYYAARAAGGAGMIITEEHSTHPGDWPYEKLIHGFRPEVIGGYRRITAAVHGHGAAILAQLNHNGGQSSGMYSRRPVWAPSPAPDPLFREVPKAVEAHEIAELVAGFGLVARHCAAGGFDGVELQCSQSSIVRAFLSPAANTRTDGYGGPLRNRARLLLEIITAVRAAIGPGRALGVRICGDELTEGGITLDEAVAVARLADATGQVDYISTAIGTATATMYAVAPSMQAPPGYAMHIPAAIRRAVSVPVIGTGRIADPRQAERALADGQCDLVGVVRGQIADPDFAAKARAGQEAGIRTCLACNQECAGRVGLGRWLGCLPNPRSGRESVPRPAPRRAGRRVHVVGGGPGGLQAAVTAARRGHRVTLFEQAPRTGGQVAVAARAPGRAEFGNLVRDLAREAARLGVDIRAGHRVDAEFLLREAPDAVILATGSRPARPAWAGGQARVIDVREVADGTHAPAGTVVVIDELGFHPATSTAELLADRGCQVEMITSAMVIGQDLNLTLDYETWNIRAGAKGIRQRTDLVVVGARAAAAGAGGRPARLVLDLLHHPTGTARELPCDWAACAVPAQPADELWHALDGAPFELHRVGDCRAPRRAHAAVIEGDRAGAAL